MITIVAPRQRRYIASHPVVFCLCIGLFCVGATSLIAPDLIEQTATSLALPAWERIAFELSYTIGSAFAIIGLVRGIARLEASGMMLLASGFTVQYIAIISIRATGGVSGLFLLFLAIGCFTRGSFLVKNGYPPRPTP